MDSLQLLAKCEPQGAALEPLQNGLVTKLLDATASAKRIGTALATASLVAVELVRHRDLRFALHQAHILAWRHTVPLPFQVAAAGELQLLDDRLTEVYAEVLGGPNGKCSYDPEMTELRAAVLEAVAKLESGLPKALQPLVYKTLFNAEAAGHRLWGPCCRAIRAFVDDEDDIDTLLAAEVHPRTPPVGSHLRLCIP